jgi:hypothetical protein
MPQCPNIDCNEVCYFWTMHRSCCVLGSFTLGARRGGRLMGFGEAMKVESGEFREASVSLKYDFVLH